MEFRLLYYKCTFLIGIVFGSKFGGSPAANIRYEGTNDSNIPPGVNVRSCRQRDVHACVGIKLLSSGLERGEAPWQADVRHHVRC